MRKVIAILLLASTSAVAWDVGFNFRSTVGYVTDPVPTVMALFGSTNYPTTRTINGQSVTFGWETLGSDISTRDRISSWDPRLAGIACQSDASFSVFRVDLPASGSYLLGLAMGDAPNPRSSHVEFQSGTSTVLVVQATNPYNSFTDATAAGRYFSDWPSANATVQRTFTSTIFRLKIGGNSDGSYSCISHLRITSAPTPPSTARPSQFILQ